MNALAISDPAIFAGTEEGVRILWYPEPPTSVDNPKEALTGVVHEQNYLNQLNPSAKITFELPAESFVTMKIFDTLGGEVTALISQEMPAGKHTQQWNAHKYTAGAYIYRLQAGNYSTVKKLLLLK